MGSRWMGWLDERREERKEREREKKGGEKGSMLLRTKIVRKENSPLENK